MRRKDMRKAVQPLVAALNPYSSQVEAFASNQTSREGVRMSLHFSKSEEGFCSRKEGRPLETLKLNGLCTI